MCILNVVQELQVTLPSLSAPYAAATMSSLRHLCADARKAKGAVIHPPIDADIVPGRYAEVVGQQKDHCQHQGPPQAK